MEELSADREAALQRYRSLFSEDAVSGADLGRGRQVYERTCAVCHKMYGEGGDLGPDITGANRADLSYILDNILNPSGEIPEGYRMVFITTTDGRAYTGTVASETDRQVTLRMIGDDPVVIEKSEIQARESPDVSLMPEGLLNTLSDEDAIALIAYLRTGEQVPKKAD